MNDSARDVAREDVIRTRAYYLWEAAGRPEGRADEFWRAAEAVEEASEAWRHHRECTFVAAEAPDGPNFWASLVAPFNYFASVMWQAFTPRAWSECPS